MAQSGVFLVESGLRGSGYGRHLVEYANAFCREKGYQTVVLWKNSELKSTRSMYEKNGFQLKETRIQTLSNYELIEEKWELCI